MIFLKNLWIIIVIFMITATHQALCAQPSQNQQIKEAIPLPMVTGIDFDPNKPVQDLSDGWHYLIDANDTIGLEEIITKIAGNKLERLDANRNNFGITRHPHWFAGFMPNPTAQNLDFLLELDYPLLDHVDFYIVDGFGTILHHYQAGDQRALSKREISYRNPVFPIHLPASDSILVIFRIQTLGTLTFTPRLWQSQTFIADVSRQQYLFGIYYGMLIMMLVYSIFMYVRLREQVYAAYAFYIVCFSAFQASLNGFTYEYLWSEYPLLSNYAIPVSSYLGLISMLTFTSYFLSIKERSKTLYICLSTLRAMAGLLLLTIGFLEYDRLLQFVSVLGGISFLFCLFSGFHGFAQGYRPAKFYVVAWTLFILGLVALSLRNLGIVSHNFLSIYGAQIGSILEMVILTLGIADRIHMEKQARLKATEQALKAEQQAFQAQLQLNRSVERFVPHDFIALLGKRDILEVNLGQNISKILTTLFCDIRSYTTISEQLGASQGFAFLNDYYRWVAPVIRDHHGVIDKYIGDGIMAVFEHEPDHAINAGLALLSAVAEFNQVNRWTDQPIHIGIGINTGSSVLGIIGEDSRLEGTVLGDAVNLAARVEGVTSTYGIPLIITNHTYNNLNHPGKFYIRYIGNTKVKGKEENVEMFEIFDHNAEPLRSLKKQHQSTLEQAIRAFHQNEIDLSIQILEGYIPTVPDDHIALIYLEKCHSQLLSNGLWNTKAI